MWGHKAAECMVHMVGEMGLESEKPIGERKNADDVGSMDAEKGGDE